MSKPYIVRTAIRAERFEGWVWQAEFDGGTFLTITNPINRHRVVCEARKIDYRFVAEYNDRTDGNFRIKIRNDPARFPMLVISDHYRARLAIKTTDVDNVTNRIPLEIKRSRLQPLARIRAHLQHPNSQVAATTWLTLVGLFVGIVGLTSVIVDIVTLLRT